MALSMAKPTIGPTTTTNAISSILEAPNVAGLLNFAPSERGTQALSLLDMLRLNPRGYGMGPAYDAPGKPGELRAGPSRTDQAIDAINNSLPRKVLHSIVMQPVEATHAVRDAILDPSIANVTNAGAQTAMTLLQPAKALKMLGAGYGAALAKDVGLIDPSKIEPGLLGGLVSSAEAAKKVPPAPEFKARPGLTPEQNDELAKAKAKIEKGDFDSGADRRATEATVNRLEELSAGFTKTKNENEQREAAKKAEAAQDEYNRATQRAEGAASKELARDRRFSETEFGKVYNKTGGAAAAAAAFGGGVLNKLATGGKGLMSGLALPAVEGTGLAFTANNLPLAYDAFLTDADNPKKAASLAYARELEPGDPRRSRAEKDAALLPDKNPVRSEALDEFWNQFWPRLGTSAVEGIPSALTGNHFVPAIRSAVGMTARAPGRALENYYGAMTGAEKARAEMLAARNGAEGIANEVAATRSAVPPRRLEPQQGLLPPPTTRQSISAAEPAERLAGPTSGEETTMKMIEDMRRSGASQAQIDAVLKSLRRGLLP